MNKRLVIIVLGLWSLTYCAFGQASVVAPYDPGAARKSDLGTMAAEAATDYVATDTFTGHTGATGSAVHGLGTISTFASDDYVATSSLAERLDTGNASFSENIDVAGNVGAATVNGVAPLTAAEKTQALVGSTTVDFSCANLSSNGSSTHTLAAGVILITRHFQASVATDTPGVFTAIGVVNSTRPRIGQLYAFNTVDGNGCIYHIVDNAVTKITGNAAFTHTKDSASAINVYVESEQLVIQNKLSAAKTVRVVFTGYTNLAP